MYPTIYTLTVTVKYLLDLRGPFQRGSSRTAKGSVWLEDWEVI